MALLSASDQQKLRDAFAEITRPVKILFFTQTIGCETCHETRRILDELPALSDKIVVEEVNVVLEKEKAAEYGIDRAPALAMLYEDAAETRDSRVRFLGAPSGYEFVSLIQALMLVGGRPSGLTAANRDRLAAVDRPLTLQVFTTPT